ncbi:MAG: RNA-binding S4 domain-containing protein [Candidatus Omnitrophota bacterium]
MEFKLKSNFIELDNLLKIMDIAASGSEAKAIILEGKVVVNNVIETRIRRKLRTGDLVCMGDLEISIV